jgi:hypothetical protein
MALIFTTVYAHSKRFLPTPLMLGHVESHTPASAMGPASVRIFYITMASAANNHVLPVTPIDAKNRATVL